MNESSRGHLSTLPPYVCTHIYHSAQLRTHTYTQIHVCTYAYIHTQIKTNLHFSLDVFVYLSIFYSHPFLFDFLFDFHLLHSSFDSTYSPFFISCESHQAEIEVNKNANINSSSAGKVFQLLRCAVGAACKSSYWENSCTHALTNASIHAPVFM